MSSAPNSYTNLAKYFHWITAILIIILLPLGGIAHDWPYSTNTELATKAMLFSLHKTLGVAVFFVALLRILYALSQTKPGPLHPERKAETLLAETVHWLLYGSLVLVPLTGWIHHAATTGFAPIWWPFGQSLPFVPKDNGIADIFASVHGVLTKVLGVSVLLHIAGALKHHIIDKDATLRRMWFGSTALPDVTYHRTPVTAPIVALAVFALAGAAAIAFADTEDTAAPVAALEQVASDWQVQSGTLGLSVVQFGNGVSGSFGDWTSDITFDPDAGPDFGSVTTTIAIGSLTLGSVTDQAMGTDFFNVDAHPTATFTGPITADGDSYVVDGTLTLKGISAPVTLPFDLTIVDGVATMTGQTTIDRLTFAIGETMADETNLGFPVTIDIDLTATRAAP